MADKKVSQLTALTGANTASGDLLYIVDVSEPVAADQSKKITLTEFQSAPVSAGTANGVAYLNGSKVLTTGSALTFDGSNLSLATNGSSFQWTNAGNNVAINGVSGQVDFYTGTSAYNKRYSIAADGTAIWTIGSEQMRLTSTGLGIGTSSPTQKLTVNGNAAVGGQQAFWYRDDDGFSSSASRRAWATTANYDVLGALSFKVSTAAGGNPLSGTTAMLLDSSGNLGLGVTPSAWGVGKAFEVGSLGNALWGANANDVRIMQNAYYSDAERYASSTTASMYRQSSGIHEWFTAPSGTAGNAISFTQAMTLDASGYLAVGSTTTAARFKAALTGASTASITTVSDFGAAGVLSLGGIGSNSQGVYLGTGDAQTGLNSGIAAGIGFLREALNWNSALAFYTNATTDGVTTNRITERMRLDSSGNLGLGVTPSASALPTFESQYGIFAGQDQINIVGNAYYGAAYTYKSTGAATRYNQTSGVHAWYTAASGTAGNAITFTQAMTLDASGNLVVGTTVASGKLSIAGASSDTWSSTTTGGLALNGVASGISTISTYADDTSIRIGAGVSQKTGLLINGQSASGGSFVSISTGGSERARITSGGDFQVSSGGSVQVGGTAARATTAGTNRLDIFDGTAPVGTLANGVSFYSASGEANVMDAAGNATLLSPHDAVTNEWIFRSKHTPTGKVLKIDVERLLKFVNDHFGLDAVHEFIED